MSILLKVIYRFIAGGFFTSWATKGNPIDSLQSLSKSKTFFIKIEKKPNFVLNQRRLQIDKSILTAKKKKKKHPKIEASHFLISNYIMKLW